MTSAIDYEELCRLEPRLTELEAEARAIEDDGSGTFFCSNFLWLPLNTRLRALLGAYRPRDPGEDLGPLNESASFVTAYEHLSRLLPPCRDCGCALFEPILAEQVAEEL